MDKQEKPDRNDSKYRYVPRQPYWMRRAVILTAAVAGVLFVASLVTALIPATAGAARYLTASMVFPIAVLIIIFGYRLIYPHTNPKSRFDEEAYQADLERYREEHEASGLEKSDD